MIRSLLLRNAGPFRGEHVVELGPRAYALVGRYETDPGRSNWSGKSFLLEMIEFALTGRLAESRAFDADGWINREESGALVRLTLEDGSTISRERRRGKPTQIVFESAAGKATQAEATAAALAHLAFSADDFRNVGYFEQGMMSRFVRTAPAERMEIVRGWFGLDVAERAVARAASRTSAAVVQIEAIRSKRDTIREMLDGLGEPADEEALRRERDVAASELKAAEDHAARVRERTIAEKAVTDFEVLAAEGRQLAALVEQLPKDLDAREIAARQETSHALASVQVTERDRDARARIARGRFDGKCPIADVQCPAHDAINRDREGAANALAVAQEKCVAATTAWRVAKGFEEKVAEEAASVREKTRELERLRARARVLQPEAKAAAKALRRTRALQKTFDLVKLRSTLAEKERALVAALAEKEHRARLESELERLSAQVLEVGATVSAAAGAHAVLRAAERRVSERALDGIVADANAMMLDAGIDLSVSARWERAGKSAARACEACGSAFPSSVKVKQCTACGSERGLGVTRRLDFLLSDRSGAADGLAGVALQLSAGAWLLRKRSSPWATAMLDEPLAACDRTNRRALAAQLVRLLSSGSWRQAIVVSHSADVVDMYPGRIEVVVARDGTRRIETR